MSCELVSVVLLLIGIVGLFWAINLGYPYIAEIPDAGNQNELVKCWRCPADAECQDGGFFFCADCYVASRYTIPPLLEANPGQTIMPPLNEKKSREVASISVFPDMPWYHTNRGYNEYYQRKMGSA